MHAGTLRVLVVDGQEVTRNVVLMLLEHDGHDGWAVGDPDQARCLLDRHPFDVLVIDVEPGAPSDALGLVLEVRRLPVALRPQVVLSSVSERAAIDPEGRLSGLPWVRRPLDVRSFRDLLRALSPHAPTLAAPSA